MGQYPGSFRHQDRAPSVATPWLPLALRQARNGRGLAIPRELAPGTWDSLSSDSRVPMLASRRHDAPPAVRQHHLDCRGQDADPTTMFPSSTSSTHSWVAVLWDLVHVLLACGPRLAGGYGGTVPGGSCPASARAGRPVGSPSSVRRGRTRWGRTARAARRRASAQSPRAVRPAVRSARPTRVARASQPVRRQRHARPDVGQLSDMLGVTPTPFGIPTGSRPYMYR